jgi:hypothetical protein
VSAPQRDREGQVVGKQEIATHRNRWIVDHPFEGGHVVQREWGSSRSRRYAGAPADAAEELLTRMASSRSGVLNAPWPGFNLPRGSRDALLSPTPLA